MSLQGNASLGHSVVSSKTYMCNDSGLLSKFQQKLCFENNTGNFSYQNPEGGKQLLSILISVIFYVFCAAGIVANGLSLIAIYHTSRPFKPKRIFITNLAAVDLATVLFILLTDMIDEWNICDNVSTTILISVYEVSGLTVLTLTADMFIAVCVPLHYTLSMTKVRACIIISIIWGFIIGKDLLVIAIGGSLYGGESLCQEATAAFPKPLIYINVVVCALILILSLILYIKIFLGIRKHQKMLHSEETRVQTKMNLKTTVTLLLLYSSLLVSWGPWIIAVAMLSLFGFRDPVVGNLLTVGLFLMLFNLLSDSIVFGIRMPDIRKGLKRAFRIKPRQSRSYTSCPTITNDHTNASLMASTCI